jgi:Domain of unknown function (DUF1840)
MLYRFKSGDDGEVIMTDTRGEQMLTIIGKTPSPKGIVAAAALPAAILALEQAVSAEEASNEVTDDDRVTLRQRAWPLLEMFKHAQRAQVAVVWGV